MEREEHRLGYHHTVGSNVYLCFCGFLQAGEAVVPPIYSSFYPSQHFSYKDIAVDSLKQPSFITVDIKHSKIDPFCKGVQQSLAVEEVPVPSGSITGIEKTKKMAYYSVSGSLTR